MGSSTTIPTLETMRIWSLCACGEGQILTYTDKHNKIDSIFYSQIIL